MHFNSVVIIFDVIIILADPTILPTVLLSWNQFRGKKLKDTYVCLPPEGAREFQTWPFSK